MVFNFGKDLSKVKKFEELSKRAKEINKEMYKLDLDDPKTKERVQALINESKEISKQLLEIFE